MKHIGIRIPDKTKIEIDKLLAPTGTSIQFWVEKVIDNALEQRYVPGITKEKPCAKK
jgi:hypothetical protein